MNSQAGTYDGTRVPVTGTFLVVDFGSVLTFSKMVGWGSLLTLAHFFVTYGSFDNFLFRKRRHFTFYVTVLEPTNIHPTPPPCSHDYVSSCSRNSLQQNILSSLTPISCIYKVVHKIERGSLTKRCCLSVYL